MSSISTELFFNEAEFRIVIPNQTKPDEKQDPVSILQAKPREFAFYGTCKPRFSRETRTYMYLVR
jgi:hypothetical protein